MRRFGVKFQSDFLSLCHFLISVAAKMKRRVTIITVWVTAARRFPCIALGSIRKYAFLSQQRPSILLSFVISSRRS